MAKYAKPRKSRRTERRGLRPSLRLPPNIDPKDIKRMGELVQKTLRNSHEPTEKDQAILRQIYLLVLRRKALDQNDQKQAQVLLNELNNNEKTLHRLELKEYIDIRPLNFWVLEMEQSGGLEELLWQVKERCLEIKK